MRRARTLTVLVAIVLGSSTFGATQAGATTVIGVAHGFKYVEDTVGVSGGGAPWGDTANCGNSWLAFSGGTVMTGQPAEARMTASFTGGTHQTWKSTGFNTNFGKNVSTVALCRHDTAPIDYVRKNASLGAAPSTVTAQAP